MSRFLTWVATAAVMGFFACIGPAANADSIVSFSGTFGDFGYGTQPTPLENGSFSGSATFASLPTANTTAQALTADVNFYNSSNALVFSVTGGYDILTAGASGYTDLTISAGGSAGGTPVVIAPLGMTFNNWLFGQGTGTVLPYDPSTNVNSYISYTYNPNTSPTYYSDPIVSGTATVPEPSSIALGLIGVVGVLIYSRRNRRQVAA